MLRATSTSTMENPRAVAENMRAERGCGASGFITPIPSQGLCLPFAGNVMRPGVKRLQHKGSMVEWRSLTR